MEPPIKYRKCSIKYVIKLGERLFGTNPKSMICLWWRNRTPQATVFLSVRREYGSRSEAKRDLRRLKEFEEFDFEGYEEAKVVGVVKLR